MKKRTVDIIIPVHNALALVRACLQTVEGSRDPGIHRIIIVNDGSSWATRDHLRKFAKDSTNLELLENPVATGFTKAANRGLRASAADMSIVLNSDTQVSHGWIQKLEKVLFETPGVGIVGPLSNAASYQSIPRYAATPAERLQRQTAINPLPPGMTIGDVNAFLEAKRAKTPVRVPLVHGFCFVLKQELIKEVGYFDEVAFPNGYGEENDYCLRAVDAGWGLAIAVDTYVWHQKTGSYSFETRSKLVSAGMEALKTKYGELRISNAVESMQATAALISQMTKELAHDAS